MVFACFGEGCLGSWSALALWLQAERLWEVDRDMEGVAEGPCIAESPYWPGDLGGPF